jgi:hypothetical protein
MRLRKHKLRNHGVSDRAPNRPKNDRIDPTLDIDKNTGWKKQYAMFAKLGYREKCLELRIDASLANLLKALKSTRELLTSRKYLDLSSALAPLSNGSSSVPLTHQVVHDIFKKTALNFVFLVEGVFPKSDFHPVHKLHSSVPTSFSSSKESSRKATFTQSTNSTPQSHTKSASCSTTSSRHTFVTATCAGSPSISLRCTGYI